jgi:hypothetical protein
VRIYWVIFFFFCRNDEEIYDFIFLSFLCENELTVIFFLFPDPQGV